jgi:hypothetical protein
MVPVNGAAFFMVHMELWFHLAMCRYCRRFRKQLKLLRKMAKQYDAILPALFPAEQFSPEGAAIIIKIRKAHSG